MPPPPTGCYLMWKKNEWGWLKLLAIHTTLSPEWNAQCYWLPGRYTYTGAPASPGIFACSCNFRITGQKQAIAGHSVTQRAAGFPLCRGKGVQMRGGHPPVLSVVCREKWLGTVSQLSAVCHGVGSSQQQQQQQWMVKRNWRPRARLRFNRHRLSLAHAFAVLRERALMRLNATRAPVK